MNADTISALLFKRGIVVETIRDEINGDVVIDDVVKIGSIDALRQYIEERLAQAETHR